MPSQDYELLLRVRADLNQALSGLDNVRRKLGEGEQAAVQMARGGDKAAVSMNALRNAIAAVGIAKVVKDYFAAADAASNMAAKLRLVTDSAADQARVQAALFAQAQKTRSSFEGQVDLYVRLAQSSDKLRKNQSLLLDITKLVSESLVLSGADTAAAEGAIRQFAQAMASGVLRGDEFNSVMEASPRLAQAVADGLNVPRGALRAMAAQGKLTADQVIAALTSQRTAIDREFGQLPLTVGGAIQQVRNSLLKLVGDADTTAGASRDVAESVQDLARTLSSPEVKAGYTAMISGLVDVAAKASEALAAVVGFGKAVREVLRDNQDKSYDGLLQKRMALDKQISDLQKNANDPLAKLFDLHLNKGRIAELQAEMAVIDRLILARNKANKAADERSKQDAQQAAMDSGAADFIDGVLAGDKKDKGAPDKAALAAAAAAARAAAAAEAKAAAEAAAAHDQQIQSLIDLQAALDPTVKIYATFNAEREKQIKLAAVQTARKGADVEAINALRDANIALAAQQRDAALAAQQQTDAQKHLSDSLGSMPHYAGVDAVVGGAAGELLKAARQSAALEAWHAQALKENQQFSDNMLKIDRAYAAEKAALDQAKAKLTIDTAVEGFGALASAAKAAYGEQSKQYRVAFALQKAAALAQSILAIQTSIAESSKIGFPWNIVTIAGAVAQGVAILATINGTSFDAGGYTGPGGVKQPAGVVHKGEVVWSQLDVSRAGGVGTVEAMRLGYRGYADGGAVSMRHPLDGIPGPVLPGRSDLRLPASIANRESGASGGVNNNMRVYVLQNEDQLAQRLAQHPAMEKAVVVIAGENGTAITAKW